MKNNNLWWNIKIPNDLEILLEINMMTSSNGNIFRITGPLCGEFTGPGEFPTQRPVTRSFDVFFDLHLNKRLSKHSWGWWFETLSWSLWRHHNCCQSISIISLIIWNSSIYSDVNRLCRLLGHNYMYWKLSNQQPWMSAMMTKQVMVFYFLCVSKDNRGHFVYVSSQWEMVLQCNIVSHWLGAYKKWSLRQWAQINNKANLRDLIAATGLVILFKLD